MSNRQDKPQDASLPDPETVERDFREDRNLVGLFACLLRKADLFREEGSVAGSIACLNECQEIALGLSDRRGMAIVLMREADIHITQGETEMAAQVLERAYVLLRATSDILSVADVLGGLSWIAVKRERIAEALRLAREQEHILRNSGCGNTALFSCLRWQRLLMTELGHETWMIDPEIEWLSSKVKSVTVMQIDFERGMSSRSTTPSAPEPTPLRASEETLAQPHTIVRGDLAAGKAEATSLVNCTVFAPPQVSPHQCFLVQVYVHIPEAADDARSLATEFDEHATRRGFSSLGARLTIGSRLTVQLCIAPLTVEDPIQYLTWCGKTDFVQFAIHVQPDCPVTRTVGKVIVSQEGIPIGNIKFALSIVRETLHGSPEHQLTGTATRYAKAFISYASRDRPEVLKRVQMLPAVGVQYFQDVMDLSPGEMWAKQLYRYIDESDVFLLFWSTAAQMSEWVEKEWRYALDQKGQDFIHPVVIEGPPPPAPPRELADLHFGDRALYLIPVATMDIKRPNKAMDGDAK